MKHKLKQFARYAGIPLVLLLVYGTLIVLYELFNLPTQKEILNLAQVYYQDYGYWLIFISALIEGALLVNWYFPGSIVIVLGVSLAYPDPWKAFLLVLLISVGFLISAVINYALGRYGWYRLVLKLGLQEPLQKMQSKLEKKGLIMIFSSYIHPNLGALIATSAGILHLPFVKFLAYSAVALLCWNIFWGINPYIFGELLLNYLSYLIGFFLLIWVGSLLFKFPKK